MVRARTVMARPRNRGAGRGRAAFEQRPADDRALRARALERVEIGVRADAAGGEHGQARALDDAARAGRGPARRASRRGRSPCRGAARRRPRRSGRAPRRVEPASRASRACARRRRDVDRDDEPLAERVDELVAASAPNAAVPTTTRPRPRATSATASATERTPPEACTRAGAAACTQRARRARAAPARPRAVEVDDVDRARRRRRRTARRAPTGRRTATTRS